tara:strand:- start:4623 stop:4766 length:144 start_codon:yes stop_codon:yes gene_type:complete
MKTQIFKITENGESKLVKFKTDRSPEWTISQYTRNRHPLKMELIKKE